MHFLQGWTLPSMILCSFLKLLRCYYMLALRGIRSSPCLVPTLMWWWSSQGLTLLIRESTTAVILDAWPPSTQTWTWSSWLSLSIMWLHLYGIPQLEVYGERAQLSMYFLQINHVGRKKSLRKLNLRRNMNISSKKCTLKKPHPVTILHRNSSTCLNIGLSNISHMSCSLKKICSKKLDFITIVQSHSIALVTRIHLFVFSS